jgi:hypothetical protein
LQGTLLAATLLATSGAAATAPTRSTTPASITWRGWDTVAFEQARRDGKPLLVMVTAFGCHPCRTLERDLPASVTPAVGARFVALRVDADEQPHVADALALAARDSGAPAALPLLVALSPDGRRLEAAPTPSPGEREGPRRLTRWLEAAARIAALTPEPARTPPAVASPLQARAAVERLAALALPDEASDDALAPPALPALRARLDALSGEPGAAGAPERARALDGVLERAARSPVHDHVGGGFHRGRPALAPPSMRYEKRLADNALWLRAFAQGYALTRNLLYRNMVQGLVPWAIRDLRDATGAFWATIDATSGGEDGAFYRLTRDDVRAALGPERTAEFLAQYDLVPPGLPSLRGSPFAGLGPSLDVLRARRGRRVRPAPDERILAGANGLVIGALATTGAKLRRGSDLEAARRAADAVLTRLGPAAALRHSAGAHAAGGPASLGDHAYLAEGLLDLEAATGERRWRDAAVALVDAALMRLWDPAAGGFRGGVDPLVPALSPRSARDADLPAPNAIMASVLVRLGALTGEARYPRLALRTLETFAPEAERDPRAAATLIAAAKAYLRAHPAAAAPPGR